MYLAEIRKIMFQYKTGLLPDIFNNTFIPRNQVHTHDTKNDSSELSAKHTEQNPRVLCHRLYRRSRLH